MVQRRWTRRGRIKAHPKDLARRYREGASLDDLSILCGCSSRRIRAILVAVGVEIRPRGYNPGGAKKGRPKAA